LASKTYKPGDRVPVSGIYRIEHNRHRLMHEATLTKDMLFPLCRRCHAAVAFQLIRSAKGPALPFRPTEILDDFPEKTKRSRRPA
jgi:hypothetical protein